MTTLDKYGMLGYERRNTLAYTRVNFKTKKAMKEAVAAGDVLYGNKVAVYQPGPFGPDVKDGTAYLEGPHYPEAHRWYASVEVKDGVIVKVNR